MANLNVAIVRPASKTGPKPKSIFERFARHIVIDPHTNCWLWTASKSRAGYGKMGVDGALVGAHRIAYELAHGSIPDDLHICHHCDTPACVNSTHLFAGTHKENMLDKIAKGRQGQTGAKGEANGGAKLTAVDVAAIRSAYTGRYGSNLALQRQYGVSEDTIRRVVKITYWKD